MQPLYFADDWILIDASYSALMDLKFKLLKDNKDEVICSGLVKGSTEAAKRETLELLQSYLPQRFPTLFTTVEGGRTEFLAETNF